MACRAIHLKTSSDVILLSRRNSPGFRGRAVTFNDFTCIIVKYHIIQNFQYIGRMWVACALRVQAKVAIQGCNSVVFNSEY